MIDRLAPSRRPAGRNDGTQRWESLLFCHWEISPDLLRPVIPDPLQIDTYDGTAYIGVVPFKMRKIRPRWLPSVLAQDFLETNVRTYVTHKDRPGVYFFSLDANSWSAVNAARIGWSLPYHHATMAASQIGDQHHYQSQRRSGGADHRVSFRIGQSLGPSTQGSREHFLLERYLLFVQRGTAIHVGQVHHDPYDASLAEVDQIQDTLVSALGLPPLDGRPDLAHYCPGVDVEVFAIKRP